MKYASIYLCLLALFCCSCSASSQQNAQHTLNFKILDPRGIADKVTLTSTDGTPYTLKKAGIYHIPKGHYSVESICTNNTTVYGHSSDFTDSESVLQLDTTKNCSLLHDMMDDSLRELLRKNPKNP